jgi:hypothetical protein
MSTLENSNEDAVGRTYSTIKYRDHLMWLVCGSYRADDLRLID